MNSKRITALLVALTLCLALTVPAFALTAKDVTKTADIDETLQFSAADFAVTDGTLNTVTIDSLPTASAGLLKVDGANVARDQVITMASLSSMTFVPVTGYAGTTTFTWTATSTVSANARATTTLKYVDMTPVADNQTIRVLKDTMYSGKLHAADAVNSALSYSVITNPAHGDLTVSLATGTFTYTPDTGFTGNDSFQFKARNSKRESNVATVSIVVGLVGAPVASNSTVKVDYNKGVSDTVKATQTSVSGQALVYSIVAEPTKGKLTNFDPATGAFTYQHNSDRLGTDTFTFKANNGFLDSNIATVTITIELPTPFAYRDMKTHWAGLSAGTLAAFDFAIGEKIQDLYYYKPDSIITRADFLLVLNSIMQYEMSTRQDSVFADVTAEYLIGPSNTAYENGVTAGTPAGGKLYLYPHKSIARIEAIRLLDNALKLDPKSDVEVTFSDKATIPTWAMQSVRNLTGYKIITGSNGRLNPLGTLTRGEAAELLFKAYLQRKS